MAAFNNKITQELTAAGALSKLTRALSDPTFDLNDPSFSSPSTLPLLQPRTLLAFAASIRNVPAVQLILQCTRLNINQLSPESAHATALFLAVQQAGNGLDDHDDHAVAVIRSLLSHPNINVNTPSDTSATPLHLACFQGNDKLVSLLLEHPHIDPTAVSSMGNEPLRMAVQQDHAHIVRLILAYRPSVDINKSDHFGQTHLGHAIVNGFHTVCAALLERPDIDVHSPVPPFAPLAPVEYVREQVKNVFRQMNGNEVNLNLLLPSSSKPEMGQMLVWLEERVQKTTCSNCNKKGTTTLLRCARCRSVRYCDASCQKKHYKKRHKKECSKMQKNSATNASKVETEAKLANEKKRARKDAQRNAKASATSSKTTTRVVCDYCHEEKEEKFLWCNGCKAMRYCNNNTCQKKDWSIGRKKSGGPHKRICSLIHKVKQLPSEHKDLEWMDHSGGWHIGVTNCTEEPEHLAVWSLVTYETGGPESDRFMPLGRRVVRGEGRGVGNGSSSSSSFSTSSTSPTSSMLTTSDLFLMLFDSMLHPMRDALSQSGPRRPYKVTLHSHHLSNCLQAFDLTIVTDLLYRLGVREVIVDDLNKKLGFFDSWYRVQYGLPIISKLFMSRISKERRVPKIDKIYFRAPVLLKRTKKEKNKLKNRSKEKMLRKMKKRVTRLQKTHENWYVMANEAMGIGIMQLDGTTGGSRPLGRITRPDQGEDFILAVVEVILKCALDIGTRPGQLIVAQPEICSLKSVGRYEEWLNGDVATVCMGAHGNMSWTVDSGALVPGLRDDFFRCRVSL